MTSSDSQSLVGSVGVSGYSLRSNLLPIPGRQAFDEAVAFARREDALAAKFAEITTRGGGGGRRVCRRVSHRPIHCGHNFFRKSYGSPTYKYIPPLKEGRTAAYREHGSLRTFNAAHNRAYMLVQGPETRRLLGCGSAAFRAHIEAQFKPGMTWDNYGGNGSWEGRWELDHEKPCASFDLWNPEHQRVCFHYSNIRPMWVADNRKRRYV